MTYEQKDIFLRTQEASKVILHQIDSINIPLRWKTVFTSICLNRGFRKLNDVHISQMLEIGNVNSNAIYYLALQDKRTGLNMLEDLSVKVNEETSRLKAVQLILNNGIKRSKKELDLLIQTSSRMRSLFDDM